MAKKYNSRNGAIQAMENMLHQANDMVYRSVESRKPVSFEKIKQDYLAARDAAVGFGADIRGLPKEISNKYLNHLERTYKRMEMARAERNAEFDKDMRSVDVLLDDAHNETDPSTSIQILLTAVKKMGRVVDKRPELQVQRYGGRR